MNRRLLLLAALVFSLRAESSPWRDPIDPAARGRVPQQRAEKAERSTVSLIVTFRQPAELSAAMTRSAIAVRRRALDERIADLRRDLDRLERGGGRLIANAGGEPPRIDHTFHRVLFGASVRVRPVLRDAIASLPYVASVHEERMLEPFVTESAPLIRADKVWSTLNTRGAGVTVAVIDSGIDYKHVALGGGIGKDFKVAGGWDFVDDDADPMDTHGHGTWVAGIIAGNGGDFVGIAPDATLIAYRALGNFGGEEDDVIAAVERAVDPDQNGDPSDHVDIVNMSLGGKAREHDPLVQAVENATAAGVLFCIAAGNNYEYGNLSTPGFAPSAITVGASDDGDAIAAFSSRGPSWNFGIKPEIVAPGVKIHSASPNGKWVEANGTSASAPHAAAVAALVKSLHRDWTPADIKSAIVSTSALLDENVMVAGAGRIDALNATLANTLVSPPFVSYGQINPKREVWTATRTVTLRNVSAESQTLKASIRGTAEGIDVRVTPAEVTIAAGATATVSVEVTVTRNELPATPEGSFSFGGHVEWSGGAVPIHVPWAFVNATYLRIQVPDGRSDVDLDAMILSESRKFYTDFFYYEMRQFWPFETVDIVLTQTTSPSRELPWKTVVAEQVDLTADPRAVMPIGPAQLEITLQTPDEKGQLLEGLCAEAFVFELPYGRRFSFSQVPTFRRQFGPMSDRIKRYSTHSCADIGRSRVHTAIHEPVTGLRDKNVNSTLAAPRWLRQDVRFRARDGHMTAALAVMRFPGPPETYYLDGGWYFLMRPVAKPELSIFFTPSPVPQLDQVVFLERWGKCYAPSMGRDIECPLLAHTVLYLGESETRVEGDVFLEISPMAYRVPLGSPLTFGDAPVSPQVSFFSIGGYWGAGSIWLGPLSEWRQDDNRQTTVLVRDSTGTVIGDSRKGPVGGQNIIPEGEYHVESVNSNYFVAGVRGNAVVRASVNTTRSDWLLPRFTGLRIVDGNERQVSIVAPDAPASLLFSATDLDFKPPFFKRLAPREEATRAEYRLGGSTEWRPLTAMIEARQYQNNSIFGGVGTVWRASLSEVTRGFIGFVDLRIRLEDAEGNDVELLLQPAFFVGDPKRSRSVRH